MAGSEQTVEARAVDSNTGQALVFAAFHATALAGPASALAIVTQPGASAKVGVPLSPQPVVRLLDRFDNAVRHSGVTVSASINPSAGYTLSGNGTVSTNNDGVATFDGLAPSRCQRGRQDHSSPWQPRRHQAWLAQTCRLSW